MKRVGKLRALVRQMGAWNSLLYLVSRVLDRASGGRVRLIKYYIVAQPIAVSALLRPDAKTELRFTEAGDPLIRHFPRPTEVIARRYADGARCITATVNGTFAGFIWWQHDRYEEDEVRCTYVLEQPQHSVWDYDVYVAPDFRLGRTMARLWHATNRHLMAQGVRWTFSRISAFNASSLRSHAKLGMQRVSSITFWQAGSLQLATFDDPPYLHASLSRRKRPLIRLRLPELRQPGPSVTGVVGDCANSPLSKSPGREPPQ